MNPGPLCPTTGTPNCYCDVETKTKIHLTARPRDTSRKLFTDHAVFTTFFLNSYLIFGPDADVIKEMLLDNQKEIGTFFGGYLGDKVGISIASLFTKHIVSIAGFLTDLRNKQDTAQDLDAIRANIQEVAKAFSSVTGSTLPYDVVWEEFKRHNQFVIDMSMARYNGNYKLLYSKYREYYNHMLHFSDLLVNGLIH